MYLFPAEDLKRLQEEIDKIDKRIGEIGKEVGASTRDGGETSHDNFAFEQGQRQAAMWSVKLRQLVAIINNSEIVLPCRETDKVSIGLTVTVVDETTKEEDTFRIGGYMVFDEGVSISYEAPLAKIIMGARVGDFRTGKIADTIKMFRILEIK